MGDALVISLLALLCVIGSLALASVIGAYLRKVRKQRFLDGWDGEWCDD